MHVCFYVAFTFKNVSDLRNKEKNHCYISNTIIPLGMSELKTVRICMMVFGAAVSSVIGSAKCKSTFFRFMNYFACTSVQVSHFHLYFFLTIWVTHS